MLMIGATPPPSTTCRDATCGSAMPKSFFAQPTRCRLRHRKRPQRHRSSHRRRCPPTRHRFPHGASCPISLRKRRSAKRRFPVIPQPRRRGRPPKVAVDGATARPPAKRGRPRRTPLPEQPAFSFLETDDAGLDPRARSGDDRAVPGSIRSATCRPRHLVHAARRAVEAAAPQGLLVSTPRRFARVARSAMVMPRLL